uniref:Ras-related GTP-binding protein A n=1 Tax=Caenorhabditis japonica TaxID=281687 RepID=A0A8R1DK89_CAEJA
MSSKRKVLLMGKSGSGKTSMRSIIFANYIARDCSRLGPTIEVEHAHVRFLGNMVLHLWDCGGQESFMENFLMSQKDQIFKNVQVLIYVFDVESREFEKDLRYYQSCLEALLQNSPNAQVFCLIHKMDLIEEDKRDETFKKREADVLRYSELAATPLGERSNAVCQCFKSSIWDETLYKAWSAIVYHLVPNVNTMEDKLAKFGNVLEATEVILFERATFLVIAHAVLSPHKDPHRFEKVSNIIKQFKLSCLKMGSKLDSIQVRNSRFTAFIDTFTQNTYVMIVVPDGKVSAPMITMNVKNARKVFEAIETKQ